MKKQKYNHLKLQLRARRREIKEERAANYERAAYDRRVINDLRQQLKTATVEKSTEMDALIYNLHTAAKAMAEQARQGRAALRELQRIAQ